MTSKATRVVGAKVTLPGEVWVGHGRVRDGKGSRWAFRASSVEAVGWGMTDKGPVVTVSFKNTEDMRLGGEEALGFLETSLRRSMPELHAALMGPQWEGDT